MCVRGGGGGVIFGKAQSEELVIGIESILLMDEMFFCIQ